MLTFRPAGPDAASTRHRIAAAIDVARPFVSLVIVALLVWAFVRVWFGGAGAQVWGLLGDRDSFVSVVGVFVVWTVVVKAWIGAWRRRWGPTHSAVAIPGAAGAFAPAQARERATHEATHVVVALALGAQVRSVDIHLRGSIGGTTRPEWDEQKFAPAEWQWRHLVTTMSAYVTDIAEGRYLAAGSTHDLDNGRRMALTLLHMGYRPQDFEGPLTTDGLLLAAATEAAQILVAESATVARFADELCTHRSLRCDQVDQIWAERSDK